jgi:Pyridine nucleotide-disulphide oxidoreductase
MAIDQVEKVLAGGGIDLVGMVRATIADPDLVRKTAAGRTGLIRPCIACNQACAGGLNTRGRVTCTVNPSAGRELTAGDGSLRTARPRRVLVIGGGPCGVEAARAGALAGHTVTLAEAAGSLGGQLRLARSSPYRREIAGLIDYFDAVLSDLQVEVRTGVTVTADQVRELAPDAVIVATGSTPRRDCFQTLRPWGPPDGFDPAMARTSWDILAGAETGAPTGAPAGAVTGTGTGTRTGTGGTVVILDDAGHYETLDVAQLLAEQGRRVHLISRFSLVGAALEMRWDMIGAPNARLLYARDFTFYPRRVVTSLRDGVVTFARPESPGQTETLAYDDLVTISGNVPDPSLYEQLRGGPWEVRAAGDVLGPRMLEAATFEGNQAIRSLEPGWVRPVVRFGQTGSAM